MHSRTLTILLAAVAVSGPVPARAQAWGNGVLSSSSCGMDQLGNVTLAFAQGPWLEGWTLARIELGSAVSVPGGRLVGLSIHSGQASSATVPQTVNGGGVTLAFETPVIRRYGGGVSPLCLAINAKGFRYADDAGYATRGMRVGVGVTGRAEAQIGAVRFMGHLGAGVAQGVTVWEGRELSWNGASGYELVAVRRSSFRPLPDIGLGLTARVGPVFGHTAAEWGDPETWPGPIWRAGLGFTF